MFHRHHKNGLSIAGGQSFREPRGNYCAGMKGYVINRNSLLMNERVKEYSRNTVL